jgi:hypothetical protein
MNYKLVQRQLDISAEELEKQGHSDLADKVDQCNAKLAKATKVIAFVLSKINKEADRRIAAKAPKGTKESPNRAAMQRRKEGTRERVKKILESRRAARELEKELLDGLELHEEATSARNEDALRQWRKDRVKSAKINALKKQLADLEEGDD